VTADGKIVSLTAGIKGYPRYFSAMLGDTALLRPDPVGEGDTTGLRDAGPDA
jgi:hypothetical protein